jgi:hypothetical protein
MIYATNSPLFRNFLILTQQIFVQKRPEPYDFDLKIDPELQVKEIIWSFRNLPNPGPASLQNWYTGENDLSSRIPTFP